jgi:hypothetical protein
LGDPRPSEIELGWALGGRKGLFQQERMYALLQHYRQPLIQFSLDILMLEAGNTSISYGLSETSTNASNHGDQTSDARQHKRVFTTPPGDLKSNKRRRTPDGDKQAKKTGIHCAKLHSIQALRFACPYFKRDPIEFGKRGACSGPGWESVHRLK